jgi:predicted murein hydrolase (TIGR00659 family)
MLPLIALLDTPFARIVVWSAITIAFYVLSKRLHARWRRWWLMPLIVTPTLLIVVVLTLHVSYAEYIKDTGWLVTLLGPATVAFAVPIFEQRNLIRRHWPVLVVGMVVGSLTSVAAGWVLATALGVDETLRLSLLPRSISTPFAMSVSQNIGGAPSLTAVFVVLTGVFGAMLGEVMLNWLPIRSTLARGALFGVGAHAVGTVKAHQIGREEGSISGLVMVLVGLINVLIAPLLTHLVG